MNLSADMRQKVLVAMAMATNAELLFLDEPTIGLDPVSRRQDMVRQLRIGKRKGSQFY